MPNISPKQQVILAAQAVVNAAFKLNPLVTAGGVPGGEVEAMGVPTVLLDELRDTIERNRTQPMPDELSVSDPSYFPELARRGSGNRTRGIGKRLAGAKGGFGGKGSKKPGSGWRRGKKGPHAPKEAAAPTRVEIAADFFIVHFEHGDPITVPFDLFPRLRDATPEQRSNVTLSATGAGIRWPDIDEDISVAGLLDRHSQ